MAGIMCAIAGAGGSPYLGTATVTVGTYVDGATTYRGFFSTLAGSIAPTTWAATGATIDYLMHYSASPVTAIQFRVLASFPNEGWTTLTIAGTSYSRSAASYTTSAGDTTWVWLNPATNPFGTVNGATKAIVWS